MIPSFVGISIAAPIGLHLGWNSIAYLVFSSGPLGAALLVPASGAQRIQANGVSLGIGLPLAATVLGLWYLRRIDRRRAVGSESEAVGANNLSREDHSSRVDDCQPGQISDPNRTASPAPGSTTR